MASRITGALITLLSSTMAKSLPTLVRVASQKRVAPRESKLNVTTHMPSWLLGWESVRFSPLTITRFMIT